MADQPPDPPPLGSEEGRTISDQLMVFQSPEDAAAKLPTKYMRLKASKSRSMERKSTPAPPTKGTGRKRFVPSPLPEDKKPWKKLEYESGESSPLGSPKCKGNIFPPSLVEENGDNNGETEDIFQPATHELSDTTKNLEVEQGSFRSEDLDLTHRKEEEMEHWNECEEDFDIPSAKSAPEGYAPPEFAATAGEQPVVSGEVQAGPCGVLVPLENVEATIPKTDNSTKATLESAFAPYLSNPPCTNTILPNLIASTKADLGSALAPPHSSMARDMLKIDEILHLAALDAVEKLDAAAAQPLLAGNLPAVSHNPPRLPQNPPGCMQSITHTPWDGNGPSLEDFPPLERGRTGKIRAAFEASAKHHETVLGHPMTKPNSSKFSAEFEASAKHHETVLGHPMTKPNSNKFRAEFEASAKQHETGLGHPMTKPNSSKNRAVFEVGAKHHEMVLGNPMTKPNSVEIRAELETSAKHHETVLGHPMNKPNSSALRDRPVAETDNEATPCAGMAEVTREAATLLDTTMDDATANNGIGGVKKIQAGNGNAEHNKSSLDDPNKNRDAAVLWEQTGKPNTLADLFKHSPEPNGPQPFEPEKIENIGIASQANGIPSIYFSGMETQRLAASIGHAIVGKFSHSIPTGRQIQNTLDSIKLRRGFNWKYINAKHILIQCEDLADYARLLGGPKGTPVWFVDRHPMRVFKWTPEFDAYCESPIAAIWCNLIGLPIHLFDHSALFAIGKLLGNPIQVDRATANKTRISFARICVEIDITKPPPEEIIIDICGRETVQQVRWDKIPSYCHECKHVGHASDVCYATGRRERPAKRNYNTTTPRQPQPKTDQPEAHEEEREINRETRDYNPNEWRRQGKKKGKALNRASEKPNGVEDADMGWEGPDIMKMPDIMGGTHKGSKVPPGSPSMGPKIGAGMGSHTPHPEAGTSSSSAGALEGKRGRPNGRRSNSPPRRGQPRGGARQAMSRGRGFYSNKSYLSTNQYYTLMENGEFDVDNCGEMEDSAMEMDGRCEEEMENEPPSESEEHPMNLEHHLKELHGGSSLPSGTNPSC